VPLQRQRFIDGDTPQTGLNGAAAEPFKTIAQFMASRTDNSVADVSANYVGWLMPALGGYTENVAFPHFSSTELRADSFSIASGVSITGDVTWPNTLSGGGDAATPAAVVAMHNISVSGSFTVTDGVEAPASLVIFGGDEIGRESVTLGGGFVSSATQKLSEVFFYNARIDNDIDAGTGALNAVVILLNSFCLGDITARGFASVNSSISASTIDVGAFGADFRDTEFGQAAVFTTAAGGTFDGTSWQSFIAIGGTRGAGTFVLVTGGYSGGDVPGAALTGASTSVSLNGTGATAGYTGENSGNHYTAPAGDADPTAVTLLTGGGELVGDTMLITKAGLDANALAVINGGTGAGTIGTIPTNERGFVLARFNGTDWVFAEGGSLAA
jgi:hypothetical protein